MSGKKKVTIDNKKMLASEKEFINWINSFTIEKGTVSQQEKFFELWMSFVRLPSSCDSDTIDNFLVNLVGLISVNPSIETTMTALQILFNYLK